MRSVRVAAGTAPWRRAVVRADDAAAGAGAGAGAAAGAGSAAGAPAGPGADMGGGEKLAQAHSDLRHQVNCT